MTFRHKKRELVADTVHKTIELSELEKIVISTATFNRLHNVLQNSTLFLTYPSNRTSRFSHSLGCMHIAGEIFRNSFLNSSEETKQLFLEAINNEISDVKDGLPQVYRHEFDEFKQKIIEKLLSDPHFSSITPPSLQDELQYAYLIAYESVRLSGLLHDIGHLPFSHVAEFALSEIREVVKSGNFSENLLIKDFLSMMDFLELEDGDTIAPHEKLGKDMVRIILREVCAVEIRIHPVNSWLISLVTNRILNKQTTVTSNLYKIIDGELDADRLDYVPRDLLASGTTYNIPNYERLFMSYKLVVDNDEFRFLPTIRALRGIEDFCRDYQQLYKYVLYHHRVAKTDGLLQKVLVAISLKYLTQDAPIIRQEEKPNIPNDISGLWSIFKYKSTLFATSVDQIVIDIAPEEFRKLEDRYFEKLKTWYFQWDDAWLITILRDEFLKGGGSASTNLSKNQISNTSNEDKVASGNSRPSYMTMLEELLTNKKQYYSLYKRLNTFKVVDDEFWNEMEKSILGNVKEFIGHVQSKLSSQTENILAPFIELLNWYDRFSDYEELNEMMEESEILAKEYGTLRTNILVLLSMLGEAILVQKSPLKFVEEAIDQLIDKKELNLLDAFYVQKRPKIAVKDTFKLISEEEIVPINAVSGVSKELFNSRHLSPVFFVYIYRNSSISDEELHKIRRKFGQILWKTFQNWIRS